MSVMKLKAKYIGALALFTGVGATANATWFFECIDPMNMMPYSTDYFTLGVGTPLMQATLGVSGTVTYGGMNGPCYAPTARTLEASGRFAFGIGNQGSAQSAFDNGMALTVGFPQDAAGDYCFGRISVGDDDPANSELFGDGGLSVAYVGLSDRYAILIWNGTGYQVELQVKSLADSMRMRWRMTNTGTENISLGLLFGAYVGMRSNTIDPETGANQFNSGLGSASGNPKFVDGYIGYTAFPDGRPIRQEMKRTLASQDFPAFVKFMAGQTAAYGLRVDNITPPETQDATPTNLIIIGNQRAPVSGLLADNNMRVNVAGDTTGLAESADIGLNETCFIQRFGVAPVEPGGFRDVVHYLRSPWGVANYNDPYAAVLDAPRLVSFPGGGSNGQTPNPMQVRVWIDNQYATIEKEVPLNNVQCRLDLPAGLSFAPGEQQTKIIPLISPNQLTSLTWNVVSDGVTYGDLPISVEIKPTPGPTRTLNSKIRVAARPVMTLPAAPNMVTFPYQFGDSNLDAILGLQAGIDYVAYQWDPDLRAYQPVQSVQRGVGYWVIPTNTLTDHQLLNASIHPDTGAGGLLVNLKKGWNLVGNPYNHAVPIQQLIGVAEENPTESLTWAQLVSNQFVSGAITQFVQNTALPGGGSYVINSETNTLIPPHQAFWVFVTTAKPVRLIWPPVFQETLPGSGRSAETVWKQTDRAWRLQLSARSELGQDSSNYVGVIRDKKIAEQYALPKAPTAPGSKVELAVMDVVGGEVTRMAQAVSHKGTRNEWKVQVKAEEAGTITLTWPNLPSIPRGLRAKLVDDASGLRKDLRSTTGYTFHMDKPGTRTFTIIVEPGGSNKPVIGNVLVTPAGRSGNSPVVINYALSADALVTVRVLSATGKEVFTVTRGRADSAGENQITWTLRDNANRAVAPGTYQVEILAETPNGERVRKLVPVNVIR